MAKNFKKSQNIDFVFQAILKRLKKDAIVLRQEAIPKYRDMLKSQMNNLYEDNFSKIKKYSNDPNFLNVLNKTAAEKFTNKIIAMRSGNNSQSKSRSKKSQEYKSSKGSTNNKGPDMHSAYDVSGGQYAEFNSKKSRSKQDPRTYDNRKMGGHTLPNKQRERDNDTHPGKKNTVPKRPSFTSMKKDKTLPGMEEGFNSSVGAPLTKGAKDGYYKSTGEFVRGNMQDDEEGVDYGDDMGVGFNGRSYSGGEKKSNRMGRADGRQTEFEQRMEKEMNSRQFSGKRVPPEINFSKQRGRQSGNMTAQYQDQQNMNPNTMINPNMMGMNMNPNMMNMNPNMMGMNMGPDMMGMNPAMNGFNPMNMGNGASFNEGDSDDESVFPQWNGPNNNEGMSNNNNGGFDMNQGGNLQYNPNIPMNGPNNLRSGSGGYQNQQQMPIKRKTGGGRFDSAYEQKIRERNLIDIETEQPGDTSLAYQSRNNDQYFDGNQGGMNSGMMNPMQMGGFTPGQPNMQNNGFNQMGMNFPNQMANPMMGGNSSFFFEQSKEKHSITKRKKKDKNKSKSDTKKKTKKKKRDSSSDSDSSGKHKSKKKLKEDSGLNFMSNIATYNSSNVSNLNTKSVVTVIDSDDELLAPPKINRTNQGNRFNQQYNQTNPRQSTSYSRQDTISNSSEDVKLRKIEEATKKLLEAKKELEMQERKTHESMKKEHSQEMKELKSSFDKPKKSKKESEKIKSKTNSNSNKPEKDIIEINSQDYADDATLNDYSVPLKKEYKNIKKVILEDYTIPSPEYELKEDSFFYYSQNETEKSIKIEPGKYTATKILQLIGEELSKDDFRLSVKSSAGIVTISNEEQTFNLVNKPGSINRILGFTDNNSTNCSTISGNQPFKWVIDNKIDLYLNSEKFGSINTTINSSKLQKKYEKEFKKPITWSELINIEFKSNGKLHKFYGKQHILRFKLVF